MMEGPSFALFTAVHIIPGTEPDILKYPITVCQTNDFQIWRYIELSYLKVVSLN